MNQKPSPNEKKLVQIDLEIKSDELKVSSNTAGKQSVTTAVKGELDSVVSHGIVKVKVSPDIFRKKE